MNENEKRRLEGTWQRRKGRTRVTRERKIVAGWGEGKCGALGKRLTRNDRRRRRDSMEEERREEDAAAAAATAEEEKKKKKRWKEAEKK